MSVTSLIEFDDAAEHIFNSSTLQLLDDKGQLKSQVKPSEIFFFNNETDGYATSKRGNKTLVFSGVDNTASIVDGWLTFNNDQSLATVAGVTGITSSWAFRTLIRANVAAVVASRTLFRIKSNTTSAQVHVYYENNGGGITRIVMQVINDLGSVVHTQILVLFNLNTDPQCCVAFSVDASAGFIYCYVSGDLKATLSKPAAFTFTNCDVIFGNNESTDSAADFDDMQLFSAHVFTTEAESIYPEPTTYVLTEQIMQTIIPLLVDTPISFSGVQEVPAGTQMKHFAYLDGSAYYHNGTSWVLIDPTSPYLSQSSTLAEFIAAWPSLPIVPGIGKTVKIGTVFKSDSGYATPLLESMTAVYKYTFKAGEVPLCAIYGTVLNNAGQVVSGAKVWVKSTDTLINAALIGPAAYVTTNAEGKYSVSVPQGITATFTHEYLDSEPGGASPITGYVTKKYPNKLIPAVATQAFDQLADA